MFVTYYPGYVSLQSPTLCITLFSFYIPWSLLKVIIYGFFFWKFKKKRVIRCHCRQPHIATNFPSLYRVYHGSKSSLHYFMFCIFFYLFCRCCCHFRCFYCKMSSYGVSLVSFIHVCWKYALIQLLTIKKLAFPWNMPLNPCQT